MLSAVVLLALVSGSFTHENAGSCDSRSGHDCQAAAERSAGNSLLQLAGASASAVKRRQLGDGDFDFGDDKRAPVKQVSYFNLTKTIGDQVDSMTSDLTKLDSNVKKMSDKTKDELSKIEKKVDEVPNETMLAIKDEVDALHDDVKKLIKLANATTPAPVARRRRRR
mmetsp:Transcript_113235/g.212144  ORF Transcript_113235/g.212144 Transcript_113235/m.212144 type:complete len:167 (+) Transcript_113235:79-579(+)